MASSATLSAGRSFLDECRKVAEKQDYRQNRRRSWRGENGMPEASRKDYVLQCLAEAARRGHMTLTADEVADEIGIDRSTASRYLNALASEGQVLKVSGRPRRFALRDATDEDRDNGLDKRFQGVVGVDASLKEVWDDAKAAVTYPGGRMHCIIIGPPGTGKTLLGQMMYEFGVSRGVFGRHRFVSFNCADYASNPQLLLSQLYGHVKGAFTGAHRDRVGLVERADGGVLFLDEVHRLPPEGQELLFSLMDFGTFRRLGSEEQRRVSVFVIGATSEAIESKLLVTFLRRFPVRLALPSFSERCVDERVSLILHFLGQEASNLGKVVRVNRDRIEELASGDYKGNIGELRNRIQLASARAYLRCLTSGNSEVVIDSADLRLEPSPAVTREVSLYCQAVLPQVLTFRAKGASDPARVREPGAGIDLCAFIKDRFRLHRERGLPPAEAGGLVEREINALFRTLDTTQCKNRVTVESEILSAVEVALAQFEKTTGCPALKTAAYWIAAHIQSVISMVENGWYERNDASVFSPLDIGVEELRIAGELVDAVRRITGREIPSDEVVRIALLIRGTSKRVTATVPEDALPTGSPRIVVFCHTGKGSVEMCREKIRVLGVPDELIKTAASTDPLVERPIPHNVIYIGPFNPGVSEANFVGMDRIFTEDNEALKDKLSTIVGSSKQNARASLIKSVLKSVGKAKNAAEIVFDVADRIARLEEYTHVRLDDGLYASILLHFVASALRGRVLTPPKLPIHEYEVVLGMTLELTEIDVLCKVCNAESSCV